MAASKKIKRSVTKNVRFRPEDLELIERLKAKTGASTTSEVIRQGLRAMAEKEGIR